MNAVLHINIPCNVNASLRPPPLPWSPLLIQTKTNYLASARFSTLCSKLWNSLPRIHLDVPNSVNFIFFIRYTKKIQAAQRRFALICLNCLLDRYWQYTTLVNCLWQSWDISSSIITKLHGLWCGETQINRRYVAG